MTLFADSTALIALGEIQAIDLLRLYAEIVVITPAVRHEVLRSAPQVTEAVSSGWMRVEDSDPIAVQSIIDETELDTGESSIIEVARRIGTRDDEILIDERRAFTVLEKAGDSRRICLAQVLHQIEERHPAHSCEDIMRRLVSEDRYRWAKTVLWHYERWCAESGRVPIFHHVR